MKTIIRNRNTNEIMFESENGTLKELVEKNKSNLNEADLRIANLSGANLQNTLALLQCPETGSFIGWKKCQDGIIVKLQIHAKAKRSSATSRDCRAESVKVLQVYGAETGKSFRKDKNNEHTIYKKGKIILCDEWEDDRWEECAGGIHFFITRKEAEDFNY